MRDIFFFDSMLTPKIITFVYWLLLLIAVVGGLGAIFSGLILEGLGTLVAGSIGARIWCELLVVLFKINENIKTLSEK
jgi:hypothetical protein